MALDTIVPQMMNAASGTILWLHAVMMVSAKPPDLTMTLRTTLAATVLDSVAAQMLNAASGMIP